MSDGAASDSSPGHAASTLLSTLADECADHAVRLLQSASSNSFCSMLSLRKFRQVAWLQPLSLSLLLPLLLLFAIFSSASFGLSANEGVHRSSLPEPSRFLEWAQGQVSLSSAGGQREQGKGLSFSPQALGCKVALLLHVPKTGGTTFSQEIFGSWQERLGFHVFRYRLSPGASMTHPEPGLAAPLDKSRAQFGLHADLSWEKLAERLVQVGLDTLTDVSSLRVAVELHFCLGLRASVDTLQSIRAALEPRGCTVVVGTLVREPFDHQLSWLGASLGELHTSDECRSAAKLGWSFSS